MQQSTHYQSDSMEAIEFLERVANLMDGTGIKPRNVYMLCTALKYALRAGKKGDWREDAYKCADYLCRALTGRWIHERSGK